MKEGIDDRKKTPKEKKKSGAAIGAKGIIAGDFLTSEKIDKHIGFLLYIVLLAFIYISMGNQVDAAAKSARKWEEQIKEIKSQYITEYRNLNRKRTAMHIKELIETHNIDLKELNTPPYIISADGHK
ncbi:MAG: hypothetical protein LBU90_00690 [Bacteroidales bacterium]|jgi:hypothetical protein|nr:hypothetical protein [Bacteroidales bacterium]